MDPDKNVEDKTIEEAALNIFGGSTSGSGEEELLRIASNFALQLSARQINRLLWLKLAALRLRNAKKDNLAIVFDAFITNWLEWKKYNGSEAYIMRGLDSISMRRYLNEGSFKVNIDK